MHTDQAQRVAPTEVVAAPVRPVRAGVVGMVPIAVAYVPFALTVGSAVGADRSPGAAWFGTWTIYGGSAQLAVLQNLGHAGVLMAVVTGLVINARMLVYSSSLAADWRAQPRWFRLTTAATLIDPTWAAGRYAIDHYGTPREQREYYLGSAAALTLIWVGAVTIGALAGSRLDHTVDLSVTGPLCLVALVGPRLAARASRMPVAVAGATALALSWAPAGVPIIAAVIAGAWVAARSDGGAR